jgi:formate hydrogenlyase subunit 3/multisubunit Na+/H+ antiporter MnhD subunit
LHLHPILPPTKRRARELHAAYENGHPPTATCLQTGSLSMVRFPPIDLFTIQFALFVHIAARFRTTLRTLQGYALMGRVGRLVVFTKIANHLLLKDGLEFIKASKYKAAAHAIALLPRRITRRTARGLGDPGSTTKVYAPSPPRGLALCSHTR